ncbi:hypothetical protein MNV49_002877 [Pseudohyphozyma bogoriensis]|nr:hypothetical protein MNV49_002877 [Pseudohyphozyma bogoriensis]
MFATSLAALALVAPAFAQLSTFRATIPGAIHQCEATNAFFFDSGASRPLDLLFLPSASVPASLRTGTTTIDVAIQYNPLLAISGITTADAAEFDFTMQIAAGQVVEVFGFLPDGTGKALSLTRTIMTPLPSASACLTNVQTTIAGVGAAAVTTSAAGTFFISPSCGHHDLGRSAASTSATSSVNAGVTTIIASTSTQSGAKPLLISSAVGFAALVGAVAFLG